MGLEMIFGIGALVLFGVLIWSVMRNRQNPHNRRVAEAATRDQYKHPDSYDADKSRAQLVPNPDGSIPNKHGEGSHDR